MPARQANCTEPPVSAEDLRLIAALRCAPYKCDARIYIQDNHSSGCRLLVAQYGPGYIGRDLPIADNGCPEFRAGIPYDMNEQEILDKLLPMDRDAPYPKWEVPMRVYGSPMLFRWWQGRP